MDEARHDGLYELEIALDLMPKGEAAYAAHGWSIGCSATFWPMSPAIPIRAEICIDKLLFAGLARQAGSALLSSAHSRCRRIRAHERWRSNC